MSRLQISAIHRARWGARILVCGLLVPGAVLWQPVSVSARVDDLRGRWDIIVDAPGVEEPTLLLFVNDLEPGPKGYLAAGCMEASGGLAPMSLQAQPTDGGNYTISLRSTIIPADGDPYGIQLFGPVETFGRGVADDVGGGADSMARTDFGEGYWTGIHHDRRRKKCPAAEIPPLSFWGDVRLRRDLRKGEPEQIRTLLEGQTDIASAGMLVERPDGTSVVVPPFTDIFSPEVDFVSRFRYFFDQMEDGEPIVGQPYSFTLLDALGDPIPGTMRTDVWTDCLIVPPSNITGAVTPELDINLMWDAVPKVDGFDPASGIGFYQITIDTLPGVSSPYGASGIGELNHVIPWNDFTPGDPGLPDGFDFGVALKRLTNGSYSIRVESFSVPPSVSSGVVLECETVDFDEVLLFDKGDASITLPGSP